MQFIFLILLLSTAAFGGSANTIAPAKKVHFPIIFEDDLHFKNMLTAIERQEKSFSTYNEASLKTKVLFGKRTVTRSHLVKSLERFKKIVTVALECSKEFSRRVCMTSFNISMNLQYEAYRPIPKKTEKGYKENKTFFTAYYSPDLHGSKTKTDEFLNPIYAMPLSKALKSKTSDEINFENSLAGKKLELFYVKESKFDIWLLHIEGGGRVKVQEGDKFKYYYLSYAGTNGKTLNMLYKYMLEKNLISKGHTSVNEQRQAFNDNQDLQREILKFSPSYVYFKITKSEPLGVKNIPLTEHRSLASDYRIFKEYGLINFVKMKKPVRKPDGKVKKVKFGRFFINQDTGGAIKGNARADLYFGYGKEAELSANYIYGLGEQYILILK